MGREFEVCLIIDKLRGFDSLEGAEACLWPFRLARPENRIFPLCNLTQPGGLGIIERNLTKSQQKRHRAAARRVRPPLPTRGKTAPQPPEIPSPRPKAPAPTPSPTTRPFPQRHPPIHPSPPAPDCASPPAPRPPASPWPSSSPVKVPNPQVASAVLGGRDCRWARPRGQHARGRSSKGIDGRPTRWLQARDRRAVRARGRRLRPARGRGSSAGGC